ncbi:hypothetical protein HAZT_HAZT011963 [Hyalella azteca]|uniref:Cold-shock protein CS120 n=1 Tax=Hyalella azteca TaxID=294128 RepID=A0A6A0H2H2_HYAAZ|nr:cold-shock protein CS120 [Hyalella azteca]KAA0197142.1 hypothetical protein HAZT_HAZT011963 [Hyalella azteca]
MLDPKFLGIIYFVWLSLLEADAAPYATLRFSNAFDASLKHNINKRNAEAEPAPEAVADASSDATSQPDAIAEASASAEAQSFGAFHPHQVHPSQHAFIPSHGPPHHGADHLQSIHILRGHPHDGHPRGHPVGLGGHLIGGHINDRPPNPGAHLVHPGHQSHQDNFRHLSHPDFNFQGGPVGGRVRSRGLGYDFTYDIGGHPIHGTQQHKHRVIHHKVRDDNHHDDNNDEYHEDDDENYDENRITSGYGLTKHVRIHPHGGGPFHGRGLNDGPFTSVVTSHPVHHGRHGLFGHPISGQLGSRGHIGNPGGPSVGFIGPGVHGAPLGFRSHVEPGGFDGRIGHGVHGGLGGPVGGHGGFIGGVGIHDIGHSGLIAHDLREAHGIGQIFEHGGPRHTLITRQHLGHPTSHGGHDIRGHGGPGFIGHSHGGTIGRGFPGGGFNRGKELEIEPDGKFNPIEGFETPKRQLDDIGNGVSDGLKHIGNSSGRLSREKPIRHERYYAETTAHDSDVI